MRILGIDPGSNVTGYGVLERADSGLVHVAHGTLKLRRGTALAERLYQLYGTVRELVEEHRPEVAAVELVFVAASPRAALVLGQARGAVLSALGAMGLGVCEYAPADIKRAVTGSGRADKRQVQRMVRRILALERLPVPDAADALAVAIRHAHGARLEALGVLAPGRRRSARRGVHVAVGRVR
jgi:crossover junction endodeoxyribonuclease RuvC